MQVIRQITRHVRAGRVRTRPPVARRLSWSFAALLGLLMIGLPFSVPAVGAGVLDLPDRSAPPEATPVDESADLDALVAAEGDAPVPAEPEPAPENSPPPPDPDPCADALAQVEGLGLGLPPGVDYHCPSTQFPHQGAACWNASPCRGRGFIAINMERLQGASTEYLRFVVAHEVCHIRDFQATGTTSEASADACAAAHGA